MRPPLAEIAEIAEIAFATLEVIIFADSSNHNPQNVGGQESHR